MLRSFTIFSTLIRNPIKLHSTPSVEDQTLTISAETDFTNDSVITELIEENNVNTIVISAPIQTIPKKDYFKTIQTVKITSTSTTALEAGLFQNNAYITEVQLPTSITSLPDYCFAYSSISKIDISKITTFGASCFAHCPLLTNISFPGSEIPSGFAAHCYALTQVDLAKSTISIGASAFSHCISLKTIDFAKISTIGENSFEFTNILELKIVSTIISIGTQAFQYSNLSTLTFSSINSNLAISSQAFRGCLFKSVIVPAISLTNSEYLFGECPYLQKITLDSTTIAIPAGFCRDCLNLTTVSAPGVTEIGENAFFNCKSLNSVTFGTITAFGNSCFRFCESLKYTIPVETTTIGDYSFAYCQNLVLSDLPNSLSIGNFAFLGVNSIQSLTVNYSLGKGCFQGCGYLTTVTIKSPCTVIPQFTFCNCSNLTKVTFSDIIDEIDSYAFSSIGIVSLLNISSVNLVKSFAFSYSGVKSILIQNTTENLAFFGCSQLQKVTISSTCEDFNPMSFLNISDLSISVKSDNHNLQIVNKTIYKNQTIICCVLPTYSDSLFNVSDFVTEIGKYAFCLNTEVETLEIHSYLVLNSQEYSHFKILNITKIPKSTPMIIESFGDSYNLRKISIKTSISKIKEYAFKNCYKLSEVEISDDTILLKGAFSNCYSLESFTLPYMKNSEDLDYSYLFMNCIKLSSVTIKPTMITLKEGMFMNTGFKEFTVPNTIQEIESKCFANCEKLYRITLGNSITKIDSQNDWFIGNKFTLVLHKYVNYIDSNAFVNYPNLKEITIPNDNPYYLSESQCIVEKTTNALITTYGVLPQQFKIPSSVEIVEENSLKDLRNNEIPFEGEKFTNEKPASIIIIPSSVKEFKHQSIATTYSVCYQGEYFQTENLRGTYAFVEKNYFNPSVFGENVVYKCDKSLSDDYKWRHIIGMTAAEIGLTVAAVILGVGLIVIVILYFVCSNDWLDV